MKAILFLLVLLAAGCSSVQVGNDKMVRVIEYGAQADLVGDGQVGGCKVQTSDFPIEGNLILTYDGEKCDVEYSRGY